jgi:hypothetical protein
MKDKAKEILGADLNQSLHHLIGYWYATDASEVFDTELACAMIDYCLKEVRNPVGKEQHQIELMESLIEKYEAQREFYADTENWHGFDGAEIAAVDWQTFRDDKDSPYWKSGKRARELANDEDFINYWSEKK